MVPCRGLEGDTPSILKDYEGGTGWDTSVCYHKYPENPDFICKAT